MVTIKNPLSGGGAGGSGGADVVNGIIEQYKAESGTIDANTFVEYVNGGAAGVGESAELSDSVMEYTDSYCVAVALGTGKVLVLYGAADVLYGVVVATNGALITTGTAVRVSSSSYSGMYFSACKLNSGEVLVAHGSGTNKLSATLLSVAETAISVGGTTLLDSSFGLETAGVAAVEVMNGTACVFFANNNSNRYLYGIACAISGTNLTAGSSTALVTGSSTNARAISASEFDNKAFVIFTKTSSQYAYGLICTVTGTTISKGSDVRLMAAATVGTGVAAASLEDGVFVEAVSTDSADFHYLYGAMCTVTGTSITCGTAARAGIAIYTASALSKAQVISINATMTLTVIRGYSAAGSLYSTMAQVYDGAVEFGEPQKLLDGVYRECTVGLVDNTKAIVAYGNSNKNPCGFVLDLANAIYVRPATAKIVGLTKSVLTSEVTGDVWVLDTST